MAKGKKLDKVDKAMKGKTNKMMKQSGAGKMAKQDANKSKKY